ncbi:MAG: serine hydrolase domain-containing protein, partial [Halobaculum sp.]
GAAATATTAYAVGSVAKSVTATAVVRLADAGRLSVDDPVADHLPWFGDAPGAPITIHDLLTHTSGLPAAGMEAFVLGPALGVDTDRTLDDWAAFRSFTREWFPTRGEPGRFAYYNSGYTALGRVIERVTGESFADAVAELVFAPLGVTGAFDSDEEPSSPPCRPGSDGPEPVSLPDNPLLAPVGGLVISPRELARFGAAHASGAVPVAPDLLRTAHTAHADWRRYADGRTTGVGYGWELTPFGDDTLVGHSGSTGVSAGYVGFLRDRGLSVAVGASGPPDASPVTLGREILAALTDREPAAVDPSLAVERAVEPLTGRYESPTGVHTADVEWTGDRLTVTLGGFGPVSGETFPLVPRSLDPKPVFEHVADDGEVERAAFERTDDGVTLRYGWLYLERVGDEAADGTGERSDHGENSATDDPDTDDPATDEPTVGGPTEPDRGA